MSQKLIARWESRSGKHYAELRYDDADLSASYTGVNCGGCLGVISKPDAIAKMQAKVDSGYFQPDAAKTPMKRTL